MVVLDKGNPNLLGCAAGDPSTSTSSIRNHYLCQSVLYHSMTLQAMRV